MSYIIFLTLYTLVQELFVNKILCYKLVISCIIYSEGNLLVNITDGLAYQNSYEYIEYIINIRLSNQENEFKMKSYVQEQI